MYLQWLLIKRVFAGHSPFRVTALMTAANILLGLGTFYYMSLVIGKSSGVRAEVYEQYGGPEHFMVVGVAMNALLTVGVASVARAIDDERKQGTFTYWLMCQPRVLPLVLKASVGDFLLAAINGIVTFMVLITIFHLKFDINYGSFLAVAAVSLLAAVGVALAAAGLYVGGMKGRNPILWAWGLTTGFLAGTYVPVEIFTDPILHTATQIVPITHLLLAMRAALLRDADLTDPTLWPHLLYMAAFTAIVLPLGLWVFQRGLRRSLEQGRLID